VIPSSDQTDEVFGTHNHAINFNVVAMPIKVLVYS